MFPTATGCQGCATGAITKAGARRWEAAAAHRSGGLTLRSGNGMPVRRIWRTARERLAFKSWYTEAFQNAMRSELQAIAWANKHRAIIAEEHYLREAWSAAPYTDPLRLERFGSKLYSQFDEDGIIAEIFRRIGATSRTFVEFGVEDGTECNSLALLLQGWRGLWLEGGTEHVASIERHFAQERERGLLTIIQAFITAENINDLIVGWGSGEIDLLSIDIDGNDIHVFEALTVLQPRVVAIEYDAKFPPSIAVAPKYDARRVWQGTGYMGASLEALARVARRRGYALVGCSFVGVNAFFVRDDLAEGKFQGPFTAENHYQPARYFLWELYHPNHPRGWGPYTEIPA